MTRGLLVEQTGTEPSGAVGSFLEGLGVPYADAIGAGITFFVVFLFLYFLGRWTVLPLVDRALDRHGLDRHAKQPLRRITLGLVIFSAVAIAFGLAGFGSFLQSFATVAAAATLAIGFALQDVIKNFVAGVFIYADQPFRIGDWIEWDEFSGEVEDISLRVTRVRTFNNELLTVPNSQLTDNVIKNPVDGDRLRVTFLFGIGYDDDIDEATAIIVEEATDHEDIMDDPAPSVRVTELGDNSVGLQSRIWIEEPHRADFIKVKSEYVRAVKERLDEAGIDIPYPQRVLHGNVSTTEP